jgi:hypothetical protein
MLTVEKIMKNSSNHSVIPAPFQQIINCRTVSKT